MAKLQSVLSNDFCSILSLMLQNHLKSNQESCKIRAIDWYAKRIDSGKHGSFCNHGVVLCNFDVMYFRIEFHFDDISEWNNLHVMDTNEVTCKFL